MNLTAHEMWHHSSMNEDGTEQQNFAEKLGSGMVIAAWIVVLGMATLFFDRFMEREHNPNQKVQFAESNGAREVILQRNRQGHYVTSGKINDVKVKFLLDTGATDVSIPERIARALRLERGPEIDVTTANGTITVHMTLLRRVQIGNIVLRDVRASINPHMDAEEILLGMSFLKHLEFTQRGDQLILRQFN